MSFPQVSVVSSSKAPDISHVKSRPTANFHPSIWKDHFLSYSSEALIVEDKMIEQVDQQKKEVRKMLFVAVRNPLEKLTLVDSIQRLGVSYHFENDIDQILEEIYVAYNDLLNKYGDEDLNVVALLFRLLRQQGYKISCDIFTKFTENGKFKESLANDARGVLSLYEATHMRVHGEDLLEEALEFTIKHLQNLVANSSSWFMVEVQSALKCPLRLALPRIKAREYMLIYEQDTSHNDILLTFSKLDFNLLQKRHQKELSAITRWWKELDIPTNFPFARDRIVELYFWVLGAYFEPHFNVAREILTKVMGMISILDDIYDAYGTYEELQVFTAAIQRWDIDATNLLPEYMKFYYTVLLDLFEEIGKKVQKDGSSYRIYFAKEAVKKLVKSYLKEAEWSSKKYKPNSKEYMELALDTSGYSEVATISFLGMGDIITKEVFEWVLGRPKIIEASKMICRLMDDIVSHKFEQQREHVVPAIKCYMEEYSCSEEEACVEFHKQIADAWKDINEACHDRLIVPRPILMRVLNLSRVINLLYREEDGYTHGKGQTKLLIKSLLVDPVPN